MSKTREVEGIYWVKIEGIWYLEVEEGYEKVQTKYGFGVRKKQLKEATK